jgi:hypothetical protein
MLLHQLVQEHHVLGQHEQGAAVNDNAEPVSGVVLKGGDSETAAENHETSDEESPPDEVLKSRAEVHTHAMHRFLSAQTDVSEEVLQLYKLVCSSMRCL